LVFDNKAKYIREIENIWREINEDIAICRLHS